MDLFESLETYLTKMRCSHRLKGVLGVASRWMGMSESECPVLYHHLALVSYLLSSWRLRGRGSALAETFVSRFKDLGGTLLCGDPAVAIFASGNEIQGIRLASGKMLETHRIVAAIHPKTHPVMPGGS
jgi:phytoene dehydrogenase-like protein